MPRLEVPLDRRTLLLPSAAILLLLPSAAILLLCLQQQS